VSVIGLRTFSRHLGVSLAAVQRAIDDGRLVKSLTADKKGARKLTGIAEAEAEWNANTRPAPSSPDGGAYADLRRQIAEEQLRAARAKREAEELELAARRGELVPAAEIEAAIAEEYAAVRTKLLALPTRAKQRLTHLSPADVRVLDDLVREALGELADAAGAVIAA
jgi:phage terminase Nu1 subunit (DNA packaging protein)